MPKVSDTHDPFCPSSTGVSDGCACTFIAAIRKDQQDKTTALIIGALQLPLHILGIKPE